MDWRRLGIKHCNFPLGEVKPSKPHGLFPVLMNDVSNFISCFCLHPDFLLTLVSSTFEIRKTTSWYDSFEVLTPVTVKDRRYISTFEKNLPNLTSPSMKEAASYSETSARKLM